MSARLVLAARWIGLVVLALAIVLMIARWKLPMPQRRSEGSTLDFWRKLWRLWREKREDAREHSESLRALRGKTALLVGPEDKPMRVMAWRLEGFGCSVVKAATGAQGINQVRAKQPDLIVADSLLPDISAVDLFRSVPEFAGPIIFVGVLHSQRDELHGLGRNVVCAGRPFDPEELAAAAGHILRSTS